MTRSQANLPRLSSHVTAPENQDDRGGIYISFPCVDVNVININIYKGKFDEFKAEANFIGNFFVSRGLMVFGFTTKTGGCSDEKEKLSILQRQAIR